MSTALAPDDVVRTHEAAAGLDREPLLVLEPLLAFLADHGLDAPSDLSVTPIGDGHSNVTFALSTGVVLRRPPRGPLPPSAHDVLREARLLQALETTAVRVPRVLATSDDPRVIGAPFYVMEMVDGEVITATAPEPLDTDAEHGRIASELIDALVELHAVDHSTLGLDGFGRPSGYLERQLRRFGGLWEHNRTREVPEVAQVGRWLADNLPTAQAAPTIVHGDYRLGNVMYDAAAPAQLVAVFDWEMATIGDPLADVGYMISHWRQAGDPPTRFNLQTVTEQAGFPTRRELVERYARASGRTVRDLDWYIVLAVWKSVVFMEGNYKRALAGATDDPYLKTFGGGVVELARRALDITRDGF
jgi:aminoglycoside phosphotransferase (APT) family kinase protein